MLIRANHLETTKNLTGIDLFVTSQEANILVAALTAYNQVLQASDEQAAELLLLGLKEHLAAYAPSTLSEKLEIVE